MKFANSVILALRCGINSLSETKCNLGAHRDYVWEPQKGQGEGKFSVAQHHNVWLPTARWEAPQIGGLPVPSEALRHQPHLISQLGAGQSGPLALNPARLSCLCHL